MAYAQVLLKFGHELPRGNTAGSAPAVLRRFVSPVEMLVPFQGGLYWRGQRNAERIQVRGKLVLPQHDHRLALMPLVVRFTSRSRETRWSPARRHAAAKKR